MNRKGTRRARVVQKRPPRYSWAPSQASSTWQSQQRSVEYRRIGMTPRMPYHHRQHPDRLRRGDRHDHRHHGPGPSELNRSVTNKQITQSSVVEPPVGSYRSSRTVWHLYGGNHHAGSRRRSTSGYDLPAFATVRSNHHRNGDRCRGRQISNY